MSALVVVVVSPPCLIPPSPISSPGRSASVSPLADSVVLSQGSILDEVRGFQVRNYGGVNAAGNVSGVNEVEYGVVAGRGGLLRVPYDAARFVIRGDKRRDRGHT